MQIVTGGKLIFRVNQVLHLRRIALNVVELVGGHEMHRELVATIKDTPNRLESSESVVVDFVTTKLNKHLAPPTRGWVLQQ